MSKVKVLILLPDGVGLRNFFYSGFNNEGNVKEFDITYWNATPLSLKILGYTEVPLEEA